MEETVHETNTVDFLEEVAVGPPMLSELPVRQRATLICMF